MTRWGIGAIGGGAVTIISLFTGDINPIRSYVLVYDSVIGQSAIFGWIIRLIVLSAAGGLWVLWSNEEEPFKALQLGIAAPAALAAMLGVASPDSGKVVPIGKGSQAVQIFDAGWAGLQGRPLTVEAIDGEIAAIPIEIQPSTNGDAQERSAILATVNNFISRFSSPDRKVASDAIAALYAENQRVRRQISDSLISSLQSEGKYSYRINLYILRTLGLFSSGWFGTEAQRASVMEQKSKFNDPTINIWADRALENFKVS